VVDLLARGVPDVDLINGPFDDDVLADEIGAGVRKREYPMVGSSGESAREVTRER
jgi:hypothetical protein